jgi:hypothetical protein
MLKFSSKLQSHGLFCVLPPLSAPAAPAQVQTAQSQCGPRPEDLRECRVCVLSAEVFNAVLMGL